MKRLPVVYARDLTGKDYWRSLGEQAGDESVRASLPRELPEGASEPPSGTSRREFVALMGASMALAGLTGCRRPEEKILPYARPPEEVIPGAPLHFATAMQMYGTTLGLIVESHEGRPTKVEGNPRHAETVGATDRFAQASVLDLYDPDRSPSPRERGEARSWGDAAQFLGKVGARFKANGGKGLAIVSEGHRSPTTAAALADLKTAMPEARVVRYEPFYHHNARAGAEIAFGAPFEPVYNAVHARVLVALDADILGTEHAPIRQARGFVGGRRGEGSAPFNRLYAVESALSITGANADHRLRMRSCDIGVFAAALLHELGAAFQVELPTGLKQISAGAAAQLSPQAAKWIKVVAADLTKQRRGTTMVVAGRKQPPAVHAIAYAINSALGNVGYTVHFFKPFDPASEGPAGLVDLAKDMRAGSVDTVVMLGGNPVFNAPADADFAAALAKVPTSVSLGTHFDETAAASTWHVNRAHFLEQWSDLVTQTGTYSVVQPLIAPLYGGRTDAEVVRALLGDSRSAYALMRSAFEASVAGVANVEKAFRRCLYDGFVPKSYQPQMPEAHADALALAVKSAVPGAAGIEVTFEPDPHAFDGRFANNGWLLEWPDPIYKETWGNAAALSAKTAQKLGVSEQDLIDVRVGSATARLAVLIAPGQADDSVRIHVGLGRTHAGRVGNGVGVNTYPLRASAAFEMATGVTVTKAQSGGTVARTQEHFLMEGRPMVREASIDKFRKDPELIKKMVEEPEQVAIWDEQWEYRGHKWGMTIDLNACIGCGVCMIACQAENNIPVVGVAQVLRSREMHWLRVDRYFEGDIDDPKSVTQPMPCQQCENAPCESVCPVGATTHSPEGLNDMAYNRCIGTRYCLNNCPFKVRRFNFFNYRKDVSETEKMAMNPDVTVRSRGVMEKCTFCVQRINQAKIAAKRDGKARTEDGTAKVVDGSILSACQQACPTDAIVFGDLNDPHSRVATLAAGPRAYKLLSELNVRPRVSYLAKLRNPNPDLEST